MEIEFIRGQLQRRADERQLGKVATFSKVPIRTLHRIIKGDGNPRFNTLVALDEYLKRTHRDKKLQAEDDQK